jgi:hypothetical protein
MRLCLFLLPTGENTMRKAIVFSILGLILCSSRGFAQTDATDSISKQIQALTEIVEKLQPTVNQQQQQIDEL